MTLDHVLFAGAGFCFGLLVMGWIGEYRINRILRGERSVGPAIGTGEPRSLMDEELEAARAIAPPSDVVRPEEIDRGTDQLLAMARSEGRELSREEARQQAMVMLMQERGIIE